MKKLIFLLMVAGLIVGLTFAAEEGEKKTEKISKEDAAPVQKQPQARPGRPSVADRRGQGSADRQERYRQMLSRRADIHKQAIVELENIKKIAEEEGAARTVEALEALIAKKNDEFKKSAQQFQRQRREGAEQVQRRADSLRDRSVKKKADKSTTKKEPAQ